MSCLVCQKPLRKRGGRKYCSFACRDVGMIKRRPVSSECVICGRMYVVAARARKGYRRKLCSRACIGEFNRRNMVGKRDPSLYHDVECKTCGKTFESLKTRKREFCGRVCRSRWTWVSRDLTHKMVAKRYTVTTSQGILTVRSRWEAAFIRDFLDRQQLRWKYEPEAVTLPDGTTYTPDFYLEDDGVYVEIKGFERGPSLKKVGMMRDMGHSMLYLDADALTGLYGLDLSVEHLNSLATAVA